MDEMKYSVLVVDDHPLMRKDLCNCWSWKITSTWLARPQRHRRRSHGQRVRTGPYPARPQHEGVVGLDTLKALRAEEVTSRVVI